ncbi:unnamed protein product [Mytilus edulis]|uniref:Endonuclease/exonuclease/phosphatase domain-containing protein n=1 Tax=Mytilus edulis TaxID=6550 RepID=A0A8S3R4S8_MYTED|nr:unnamed protein product [Mytilus edulis]
MCIPEDTKCHSRKRNKERTLTTYLNYHSAKTVIDFPYERSNLKRRLELRTKDGDSLSVKLARDCYVLKIASTGSFVNELNDVLTNKSTKTNTVNENSNLNDFPNVANLNINENISRIDRDLITLKGEYIQDSEFLNKAVTTISENNTKLNNVTTKHTSRLQNLQNQMNIIRDGKILKNHSLLEERLNAVENRLSEKSNLTSDVTQLSQLVSDLANFLADLKQGQQQHVKDITQMKASIKDLRQDVRNDSLRINTITDRRMTGVCALKAKVELINEKLKDNDPAYEHLETLVASCSKSVSDLKKKTSNANRKTLNSNDMPQSEQVETILNKSKTEMTGKLQNDPILQKIPAHVANDANMIDSKYKIYAKSVDELLPTTQKCSNYRKGVALLVSSNINRYVVHEIDVDSDRIIDSLPFKPENVNILDDHGLNLSDHFPIICTFNLGDSLTRPNLSTSSTNIAWNKALSNSSLTDYAFAVSQNLWTVDTNQTDIEKYYSEIVNSLVLAAGDTLPIVKHKRHLKPYWNDHLTELHDYMIQRRNVWISEHRPRGEEYESYLSYKNSKNCFRNELRRV